MNFEKLSKLDDASREGLRDVLGGERCEAMLKQQIESGAAELWRVTVEDNEAYLITRLEVPELVICAYQGNVSAVDMVAKVIDAAKANKCDTVRFHTERPGLARLLKRFKPAATEYVFRMAVQ